MNKKIISLFLCFCFFAGLTSAYSIGKCSDSDGNLNYGRDYYEKGEITDVLTGRVVARDSCVNRNMLREYYCSSKREFLFGYHRCACLDGKCAVLLKSYCETNSGSYMTPWHSGRCRESACPRGQYIGCDFDIGFFGFSKRYREICGNSLDKDYYFSSCSYEPRCNSGDREIGRSICVGQD